MSVTTQTYNKTAKVFNFRNQAGEAKIDIFFDIDSYWGYSLNELSWHLKSAKEDKVLVNINSPGGDVTEGIAIANALKMSGKQVTTRVLGLAASIASVVLVAGDKVQAVEGSFIMIHNVWALTMGDAEELRHTADVIEKMNDQIAEIYVDKIKRSDKYSGDRAKTKRDILAMMDAETWLTAKEALALGLIDEIVKTEKTQTNNSTAKARFMNLAKNYKNMPSELKPKNGVSLASALTAKIEMFLGEEENAEMTREMLVQQIADAAELSVEEIELTISGSVDCPTMQTLEAFAAALNMPIEDAIAAAEMDGCTFEESSESDSNDEANDQTAENKACVECNKKASIWEKTIASLKNLIGLNKPADKPEKKDSNSVEIDQIKNELLAAKEENKKLSDKVKALEAQNADAAKVLEETEAKLRPIQEMSNRAGKKFENVQELIQEYNAVLAHNKQLGAPKPTPKPAAPGENSTKTEEAEKRIPKNETGEQRARRLLAERMAKNKKK